MALLIVVVTIVVVTARLGTTSTAELELREEIQEERIELEEERLRSGSRSGARIARTGAPG